MLFAVDYNDKKIHISNTQSNLQYYCPYCGVPLIVKKGEIRQHHFAHSVNHRCTDSWERKDEYDMSEWHNEWQSCFPEENQEIKLALGDTKHRADIVVNRTVIEFQHSLLSPQSFDDRNNFYLNLNYKVTWMFDIRDLVEDGRITYESFDSGLEFSWTNPKKAFSGYDFNAGHIDLFFQITADDIIQVTEVSERGFESFKSSLKMSKAEFLERVGLKDGVCLMPYFDELTSERYLAFKKKYNINLNKQQERALLAVEGSNQLIAVPGSGKTTVLVNRLGYMVAVKGIDPSKILAITFTRKAAEEMEYRFKKKFGSAYAKGITFCTINKLSKEVYMDWYGKDKNDPFDGKILRNLSIKFYRQVNDKYPLEQEIQEVMTAISYVKNMMLSVEEIREIDNEIPNFSKIYYLYKKELKNTDKKDLDDQMVSALGVLKKYQIKLEEWRNKYRYICVDEAQDTSKIQHEIIRMLSVGNNLFMVGDEDQSIYGFRGAYPRAFLNFRFDYINPYILRMETNYRSTKQIVDKAQVFISANKGRYEKNMVSAREEGEDVRLITVSTVEEQYYKILEIAKKVTDKMAILYRDNESAVVLVDLFLRNKVSFKLKKPEQNVFNSRSVRDIKDYLTIAINPNLSESADAFNRICNHGIIFLKNNQKQSVINDCGRGMSLFDALEKQMKYVGKDKKRASMFKKLMETISKQHTYDAIEMLMSSGYEKHLDEIGAGKGKVAILKMLAKQEPNISKFVDRIKELESYMDKNFGDDNALVTLSTIHTSKGLEYDNVYIIDVYDGRFPSSKTNYFSSAKDNADGDMEERRLFYVGMTRAKNSLTLFNIEDSPSAYIGELFPEIRKEQANVPQVVATSVHNKKLHNCHSQTTYYDDKMKENKKRLQYELEKVKKEEKEADENKQEKQLLISAKDMKKYFTDPLPEYQIRDASGERWVKCECCGKIQRSSEFVSYGGMDRANQNLGKCRECYKKDR